MNLHQLEIDTNKRVQLVDITEKIQNLVTLAGILEGVAHIFVPHTTAAVTINENADPSVIQDIVLWLEKSVLECNDYLHQEGNSDAHIKSVLVGNSQIVLIKNRKLLLGTWQGIFFCEFDGPRKRKLWVCL